MYYVFTPTLVVSFSVLQKIKIASSNFTCFVTFNIPCQEFWHHCTRTMGTQFFWVQIQIPNKNLGYRYKGLVFCRNNRCLIEKQYGCWLIDQKYRKYPKTYLSKLSASSQKFGISMKKKELHWASVVRGNVHKDSNLYSKYREFLWFDKHECSQYC